MLQMMLLKTYITDGYDMSIRYVCPQHHFTISKKVQVLVVASANLIGDPQKKRGRSLLEKKEEF